MKNRLFQALIVGAAAAAGVILGKEIPVEQIDKVLQIIGVL